MPWVMPLLLGLAAQNTAFEGYYQRPALHGEKIVFSAEGDLWNVSVRGGVARRITSHPDEETHAAISPDGRLVAFTARYEGPAEVYVMPLAGGRPERLTYHDDRSEVVGFTPEGEVLYRTRAYATLPKDQLVAIDPASRVVRRIPLSAASDATFDPATQSMFFVRLKKQGSKTKRYRGGTAQKIWRWKKGAEAVPLTADYAGTSEDPMFLAQRVFFASDRDDFMNLWSMKPDGTDLRQHTRHRDFDVKGAAGHGGRIVYQHGADLRVFEIGTSKDEKIPIRLTSDLDQHREKWVKSPTDYISRVNASPNGDRVAITARGELFVMPLGAGRRVQATRRPDVRFRDAKFFPDGKSLLALSDETGELEFWRVPVDGIGDPERLSKNEPAYLISSAISPDGKQIAFVDREQRLWMLTVGITRPRMIARAPGLGTFFDLAWSPDSRWLAYAVNATNMMAQIHLYSTRTKKHHPVTSDRVDSYAPRFDAEGKWLYFLADTRFVSKVPSPWGARQPEPYLDRQTKVFALPLKKGLKSKFAPANELDPAPKKEDKKEKKKEDKKEKAAVEIDLGGMQDRLHVLPIKAGNFRKLAVSQKYLFMLQMEGPHGGKKDLVAFPITNDPKKQKQSTVLSDVKDFDLTADGAKLLVLKKKDIHLFDAGEKAPKKLNEHQVDLNGWSFSLDPRREWRQLFIEAWRLERDFFYDRKMHGLDWKGVLAKYLPLVDRVTTRAELNDLISEMVAELSALHIFVFGGDMRKGPDQVFPGKLGARFKKTEKGFLVEHVYASDPVYPEKRSPLAKPGVDVEPGDVITRIDGVEASKIDDLQKMLRGKAGRQVRLSVRSRRSTDQRDVIVEPITPRADYDLRYGEWEYTRRLRVEEAAKGRIGYVHLRAMGGRNYGEWAKDFFPVFNRAGLIIDVRNNRGGNIDSWILARLLRRAWFYWQPRSGSSLWNMQYAFRGHLVVLVNEHTASDGEAFAEGFRRLGLGKVIGTRTWGGEIWLSFDNWLVDRGMASAAQTGVYSPEGVWLIEGHGVDPDIEVQNLPHETFQGRDRQLEAAVSHLQSLIAKDPRAVPPHPRYPDKRPRKQPKDVLPPSPQ